MATTPAFRDEEGYALDETLPPFVTTDDEFERWGRCIAIAEMVTGQRDPSPEARMFAASLYRSEIPTDPPPDDPQERKELADGKLVEARIADSLRKRFEELLHPRNRRGEFARKSVVLPAKLAPKSMGEVNEQWLKDHGFDEWASPGPAARLLLRGAASTAEIHRLRPAEPASPGDPTFKVVPYDTRRTRLHDAIEAKYLTGKTKTRGRPVAVFTAGGTASGKSTFLAANPDLLPHDDHTVHIDPDDLMEEFADYRKLRDAKDPYAAQAFHDEAGDLAARIAHSAAARGLNVVFDGTGNGKPRQFVHALEHFRDTHDVHVIYVNRPTKEAVWLAALRGINEHRNVPLWLVRDIHRKVSLRYVNEVSKLKWLKGLDIYDVEHGHVATLEKGKVVVLSPKGYSRFVKKAAEAEQHAPESLSEADSSHSFPAFTAGDGRESGRLPDTPVSPMLDDDEEMPYMEVREPFDFDFLFSRAATAKEKAELEKPIVEAMDLAEAATKHSGVMVALYPHPDVAKSLAQDGGEPQSDLHVTLSYHGKADELGDPEKLNDVVRGWAHGTKPLKGTVSGTGLFTGGPEPVTYASVDLPDLPEARQRLVEALEAAGLPPAKDHGFTPHLTLAYDKRDVKLPAKTRLKFDDVHVVVGGDHTVHPLQGS